MFPFIVNSEKLVLPTYFVLMSVLFSFEVFWAARRADQKGLPKNMVLDLSFWLMIGAFAGARLFHVFWELPGFYLDNPLYILYFWLGGFVFYGGFFGALIVGFLFCRLKKLSFLQMADFFAPMASFGYAIGRLGCFMAGCCYGKPTDLFWGVVFPEGVEAPAHVKIHPTQLYATFYELLIFALLMKLDRKKMAPGKLFGLWLTLHSFGRVLMESFRDDFRGQVVANVSVSTLISGALFIVGLNLLVQKRRPA